MERHLAGALDEERDGGAALDELDGVRVSHVRRLAVVDLNDLVANLQTRSRWREKNSKTNIQNVP